MAAVSDAPAPPRRSRWVMTRRRSLLALGLLVGLIYAFGPAKPAFSLACTAGAVQEWDLSNRMGSAQTEHAAKNFETQLIIARSAHYNQGCRATRH